MFGLGMGELIIIMVVALIVLGPSKLPKLAKDLGKAIREFRKAADDVKQELSADEELKKPFQELRDAMTLAPEEIRAREEAKKELTAKADEQAHAEAQAVLAQAQAKAPDPQKKPE